MRIATYDDIPRISDMVEMLVRSTKIPQTVDRAYTQAMLARFIGSPDAVVFVSDSGFLAASIQQTVVNPEPIAVEHGWYATDRSGIKMLRAFEAWAKSRDARVRLSTPATGVDLTKLGYRPVELAWV